MSKITIVDIQHKEFKRALQGYDRNEVNQFLDEIIETLEDESTMRAALEAEIADLRQRLSHMDEMKDSLNSTLVLAQRMADEMKLSAQKEAELIREEARIAGKREAGQYDDRIAEARRQYQRILDLTEQAKTDIKSRLTSFLSMLDLPTARELIETPVDPTPTVSVAAVAPHVPGDQAAGNGATPA
jgi:cell division initiation protein